MCLDRARHFLYRSHKIQSLKWLAVIRKEINNSDEISEDIKDIS